MSTAQERRRRARAALDRGNDLMDGPSWRTSVEHYETARRLYTDLGDTGALADVVCNLARVAWQQSDLDRADQLYERARDLYLDLRAWWHVAKVEQYRGNVAYTRGDLHRAGWLYERARLALRDGRYGRDVADVDVNLAALLGERGDHDRALDLLDEATHIYRGELTDNNLDDALAQVDQNRGLIHLERDEPVLAWRHLSRAFRAQRPGDDPDKTADLLHNLAGVADRLHRPDTAQALYQHAISTYERSGNNDGARTADSRLGLGALLRRDGDLDGARPHLLAAIATYRRTGEWLALARATYNLALTRALSTTERRDDLTASWLAMQSIAWGLPEVSARAEWRDTLDAATSSTLSSALAGQEILLAAELIEAMRSAPLAPDAVVPAGISATGLTVHDLPLVRPAAVDCGWNPVLVRLLEAANGVRNGTGTGVRLRTATVRLSSVLRSCSPETP